MTGDTALLDAPYNGPVSHVPSAPSPRCRRAGRSLWAMLAFMAGFAVLIWIVFSWYLRPALEAAKTANTLEKRELAAHSRLLLAVVLFILVAGILLTFRFGRFFFPRAVERAKPTKYVDAWAESAKRISVPPEDDDKEVEEGDDDDDAR